MRLPTWLNPDGTLKTGVPYWVHENYDQWARGEHHAHVDLHHLKISLQLFNARHDYIAYQRQLEITRELSRAEILTLLPVHLRESVNLPAAPAVANKQFLRELKNEQLENAQHGKRVR